MREFARGLAGTDHPLLVHVVPIRRCNIDCGYCNEYDKVSKPVETARDVRPHRQARLARHVGRRVQRRRADAAPGSRRADPAHPHAWHDRRPHHQRLPPLAKAHRGAERGRARLPADQHRQRRARRRVEEEPPAARHEAAGGWPSTPTSTSTSIRSSAAASRTRRMRAPSTRAPGSWASRRRSASSTTVPACSSRSASAERAVFDAVMSQINGRRQVVKNLYSGIRGFPDESGGRQAKRSGTAAPVRATCTSARRASCTGARSSAASPGVPLDSYTLQDIRREFMAPKWCAPMCTIGCVHRVSTMDYWRKPQGRGWQARGTRRRGTGLRDGSVLISPHGQPRIFRHHVRRRHAGSRQRGQPGA